MALTTELKLEVTGSLTLADLDEIMRQSEGWDRGTIVDVKSRSGGQRDEYYVHTVSLIEGVWREYGGGLSQ